MIDKLNKIKDYSQGSRFSCDHPPSCQQGSQPPNPLGFWRKYLSNHCITSSSLPRQLEIRVRLDHNFQAFTSHKHCMHNCCIMTQISLPDDSIKAVVLITYSKWLNKLSSCMPLLNQTGDNEFGRCAQFTNNNVTHLNIRHLFHVKWSQYPVHVQSSRYHLPIGHLAKYILIKPTIQYIRSQELMPIK